MSRPYEVTIGRLPGDQAVSVLINGYETYFFKPNEMKKAERLKKLLLQKHYHEVKTAETENKIERLLRPWSFR